MLNAFSSIKIKVNFNPTVDNLIFRLHYRYTYILFISCVILTTLYDWVGKWMTSDAVQIASDKL